MSIVVQSQDTRSQLFTLLCNRYLDRELVRTCYFVCQEIHRIAEKYHVNVNTIFFFHFFKQRN